MEDNLEYPLLSSSGHSNCCSILSIIRDGICELLIFLTFLSLFAVGLLFFLMAVYQLFHNPESQLNSVLISSFNVSKNPSGTTWDTKLSLNDPEYYFKDFHVTYDARAWLYSEDRFISMSSPSMHQTSDGQQLGLHAMFTTMQDIKEDFSRDEAVTLDLLIEANATRGIIMRRSYFNLGSFLMIDCKDLRIDFPSNQSLGTLSSGAAKSCRVQICATKSDALNGRADKCRRSSSLFKLLHTLVFSPVQIVRFSGLVIALNEDLSVESYFTRSS